jgi:hypothetical protein
LVTDAAGQPIQGAHVDVIAHTGKFGLSSGRPETTDAQGRYRIKNLKPDGRYTLQVQADRYASASLPVTLVPGDEVSSPPPIRLERLGK